MSDIHCLESYSSEVFIFWHNTADLVLLIQRHNLCLHLYADDTQSYGICDAVGNGCSERKDVNVRRGWAATVCNWTPRKLRCCGTRPANSNTRSHRNLHVSAPISCSLSDRYETWAYISTTRLPWQPTFPELCRAVSTYSDRSAPSVDLSHARFSSNLLCL